MAFPRWNFTVKEKCVMHTDAEVCDFLIAFTDDNSVRKLAAARWYYGIISMTVLTFGEKLNVEREAQKQITIV